MQNTFPFKTTLSHLCYRPIDGTLDRVSPIIDTLRPLGSRSLDKSVPSTLDLGDIGLDPMLLQLVVEQERVFDRNQGVGECRENEGWWITWCDQVERGGGGRVGCIAAVQKAVKCLRRRCLSRQHHQLESTIQSRSHVTRRPCKQVSRFSTGIESVAEISQGEDHLTSRI